MPPVTPLPASRLHAIMDPARIPWEDSSCIPVRATARAAAAPSSPGSCRRWIWLWPSRRPVTTSMYRVRAIWGVPTPCSPTLSRRPARRPCRPTSSTSTTLPIRTAHPALPARRAGAQAQGKPVRRGGGHQPRAAAPLRRQYLHAAARQAHGQVPAGAQQSAQQDEQRGGAQGLQSGHGRGRQPDALPPAQGQAPQRRGIREPGQCGAHQAQAARGNAGADHGRLHAGAEQGRGILPRRRAGP